MIRLRTLGILDLICDAGEAPRDLIGQPKRIALLTFLTMQAADRAIPRDKLLVLFWPDLSQGRGRRALSQSLYVIRKSLGDDPFAATGQETIALRPDFVSCDAVEFEAALNEGRREHALSLYGGDFLDGFYLPDAPDFDHWLEGERGRLRRLAEEGARSLASRDEEAGDLLGAARWARRLARLTPWDERSLIYLLGLLGRAGDQSGVRHEYGLYQKKLLSDSGAEPSPAVQDAFARAKQAVPVDQSLPRPTPPRVEESAALGDPGVSLEPTRRDHRWRTRAILSAAVVVSLLVFAQTRQAIGPSEGGVGIPRILVAPFANQTGDATLDPLARLAADWLSTEIARTGRVRVVPPVSALRLVTETEVEGDTTMLGRIVAAGVHGDVDLVLGGYVHGHRDSASFEVFGLDPASGEILFAVAPALPAKSTELQTLEILRRSAMGALAGQLDDRMRHWTGPASQPPSYQSYQEYSAALDLFLEGDRASQERAAELFVAAWQADTAFTAPLLWAIFAMWNSGQAERADSVAHSLERRIDRLPEWDRAMLRYHLAFIHGDLAGEYRAASEVVALAPDSEWRYIQALAARHIGCRDQALSTLRGLSPRSGWMSRWSPAYWTVRLDVHHLEGNPDGEAQDAAAALEQLTDELHPGDEYRALASEVRAAAVSGSEIRLEDYLGQVRGLGARGHRLYLKLLYWGPFDISSDRPEYRTILDSARAWYATRPASDRDAAWYLFAQWVLAYRAGEWATAQEYADRLVEAGWPVAPEYSLGPRAVLAARNDQPERARALLDSVPAVPHGRGYADYDPDFWQARVDAILGRPAEAVQHLRAANRKGVPYDEIQGMARIDFESIWDYAPLQRLLAGHSCEGI
jgi:DNA-binding SARP family transcriptional activator